MAALRLLAAAGTAAVAVFLAAGCDDGAKSARTVTVTTTSASTTARPRLPTREVRIAVVTHGEAGSQFWPLVRRGVEQAARDLGVSVSYDSAARFTPERMATLIDNAVASQPDGLVVSIPDDTVVAPAVARAAAAGIAVVAINSGERAYRDAGALLFVGQPEVAAGLGAGERMAAAGVRHAVCVIHQPGLASLEARCRGFAAAIRSAGGTATTVAFDFESTAGAERRIAKAASAPGVDGVLSLGSGAAPPALAALQDNHLLGRVKFATFDLSPEILTAIRAGQILFAVDQQPYLQGYLPIVFLTQHRLYGLLPAHGTVIPTGPSFVTRANVARVQKLVDDGIR